MEIKGLYEIATNLLKEKEAEEKLKTKKLPILIKGESKDETIKRFKKKKKKKKKKQLKRPIDLSNI